jgi:iron(III) transport system permease protein
MGRPHWEPAALSRAATVGIVRLVTRSGDPLLLVGFLGTLIVIALFVLYPVVRVLSYPSPADFLTVLDHPRWARAIANSVVMVVLSTSSATLLGLAFAMALTRPDVPGKRLFRVVSILPLFSPPFTVAFSYLLLFGRFGLITYGLLGLRMDILGWRGLWLSQTIAFFPVAALAIARVLENITASVEFAARNLGANETTVLRTVTLPLARPGLASAMLLVALFVLADFGNPLVIGGDFPLLATEAWYRIEGFADLTGAAMLASLLLFPALILFFLQRGWTGARSYTAVTGRGVRAGGVSPTPRALMALLLIVCSLVTVFVCLIYGGILIGSLATVWGVDWRPTFRHWEEALRYWPHVRNSLLISGAAGVLAPLLGFTTAFLARGNPSAGRAVLDFAATLPAAIPGVFLGIGFLLAFNAPPIELAGTMWILALALGFWNLPFAYRTAAAGLRQIDPVLEHAAANLGATSLRVLVDVYLPLLRRTAGAAFIATFVSSVTNLSITMFLVTARYLVATVSVLTLVSSNRFGAAAALTTILLVLTFGVVAVGFRWLGSGVLEG